MLLTCAGAVTMATPAMTWRTKSSVSPVLAAIWARVIPRDRADRPECVEHGRAIVACPVQTRLDDLDGGDHASCTVSASSAFGSHLRDR